MKGLSVVFTVILLVVAHRLATHMKQAGALPAEARQGHRQATATPKGGHPISPGSTLTL